MLVPSSRRALALTVLAAVGLHVGVGLWLLAPGARAGSVGGVGEGSPAPITLVSIQRTAPAAPVRPLPAAEQARPQAAPQERRPASPAIPTAAASTPAPSAQAAAKGGAASTGGSEPFVAASLSGEPVVPLSDDDAAVAGSLSLRLTIDETGRVVGSQVVSRDGLTDSAVAVFVRSFSGYEYVPARRGGRPVRSDVTMVVGVQDGEPKKQP